MLFERSIYQGLEDLRMPNLPSLLHREHFIRPITRWAVYIVRTLSCFCSLIFRLVVSNPCRPTTSLFSASPERPEA
jgi:hypothetical protein